MNYSKLHKIYFLGIGGIGMSALARYFNHLGVAVYGYDRTPTVLTDQLIKEGISIHFEDDPSKIPSDIELVVYTPAISKDLKEFEFLITKGIFIKKRAEVLGELTKLNRTIAVAGTHGKTTVSSMIAHILYNSHIGCSAFLGGITKNYNSNFLHSEQSDFIVVEADEFDRSFLQLQPELAVVTSMDPDHLDIYEDHNNLKTTFRDFVKQLKVNGTILLKKGLDLKTNEIAVKTLTYALSEIADYYGENINLAEYKYTFDLVTPSGKIINLLLDMPGIINVENAIAASAISLESGVKEEELKKALAGFSGIKRRFDVQLNTADLIYIDDYAHHPEEIRSFVQSVQKLYPSKRVLGIFQPHLFSRTRDFADEFASSLDYLDEVILLEIYPAREKPIEGIDSKVILDKINKRYKTLTNKQEIFKTLETSEFDVILTIGAGDIDQLVEPLKKFLLKRSKTVAL